MHLRILINVNTAHNMLHYIHNILKIHRKKKYLNYEFFIEQNSPFKKNIHPRNFKNLLYFYTFIIQFKELEFKKGKNKFLNVGKCKIITSTRFEA